MRHSWNNEEWGPRLEVRDVIELQVMEEKEKMAELERGREKQRRSKEERGRRTRM